MVGKTSPHLTIIDRLLFTFILLEAIFGKFHQQYGGASIAERIKVCIKSNKQEMQCFIENTIGIRDKIAHGDLKSLGSLKENLNQILNIIRIAIFGIYSFLYHI